MELPVGNKICEHGRFILVVVNRFETFNIYGYYVEVLGGKEVHKVLYDEVEGCEEIYNL